MYFLQCLLLILIHFGPWETANEPIPDELIVWWGINPLRSDFEGRWGSSGCQMVVQTAHSCEKAKGVQRRMLP